jgi:hypothetical protein
LLHLPKIGSNGSVQSGQIDGASCPELAKIALSHATIQAKPSDFPLRQRRITEISRP